MIGFRAHTSRLVIDQVLELFSEFVTRDRENEKDFEADLYERWKACYYYLVSYRIIHNPSAVFLVDWDIVNEAWRRHVPVLVLDGQTDLLKYFIKYTLVTEKATGGFKMTNFIYNLLPEKIGVVLNFNKDSFAFDVKLRRNGKIQKVILDVPGGLCETTLSTSLDSAVQALKSSCSYTISTTRYSIYDYDDILKVCESLIQEGVVPVVEWSGRSFLDFVNKIGDIFSLLDNLEPENHWKSVNGDSVKNFARAIALAGNAACGIFESICHLPSVDCETYDKKGNDKKEKTTKEVATGGLVIHVGEETKWDENLLRAILNMMNRSKSIVEHKKLVIARVRPYALRSAIAAIMARNMSHNPGSHGLAHTLAAIENKIQSNSGLESNELVALEQFLEYVKARMDFVAEVTTYWREMPWLEHLTS